MPVNRSWWRRPRLPGGLLGMLVLVVAFEREVARRESFLFPSDAWTYKQARLDAQRVAGRDLLYFGDSLIKGGVAPGVVERRTGRSGYNLAVGGGQIAVSYYLLKKSLGAGARPSAVLVNSCPGFLGQDPDLDVACWYQLLDLSDCAEFAAMLRDPAVFARLTVQKALPSVARSQTIRKAVLCALQGQPPWTPDPPTVKARNATYAGAYLLNSTPTARQSLPAWSRAVPKRFEVRPFNAASIRRFLDLTGRRGITVYWLIPPAMPGLEEEFRRSGFDADHERYLRGLIERWPHVVVVDGRGANYDLGVFFDPVHLGQSGALAYSLALGDVLARREATGDFSHWVTLPAYRPAPAGLAFDDPRRSVQPMARSTPGAPRR